MLEQDKREVQTITQKEKEADTVMPKVVAERQSQQDQSASNFSLPVEMVAESRLRLEQKVSANIDPNRIPQMPLAGNAVKNEQSVKTIDLELSTREDRETTTVLGKADQLDIQKNDKLAPPEAQPQSLSRPTETKVKLKPSLVKGFRFKKYYTSTWNPVDLVITFLANILKNLEAWFLTDLPLLIQRLRPPKGASDQQLKKTTKVISPEEALLRALRSEKVKFSGRGDDEENNNKEDDPPPRKSFD
ncbi:MAG TPA: hypothetical protein PKD37_06110 [Oligoflexia bacterium]|nr:hypothetical protein [Oligoflexia bacterium]HMP27535.1 hypothetical protein [Oligoflexia bacterium]